MAKSILDTVRIMLKPTECCICSDLLKSAVSLECGHYFCWDCVHASGELKRNYDATCLVCNKRFTCRSLEPEAQRQAVFKRCENFLKDVKARKTLFRRKNSSSESTEAPTKKQKSMDSDGKSQSKKRKSFENNKDASDDMKCSSNAAYKMSSADRSINSASRNTISTDVECSSNKHQCQFTRDESESEELPSCQDLLAYPEKYQNSIKKVIIKNKRNALKNKTNKVITDENMMNYDCFISKSSDQIKKLRKANDEQSIVKGNTSKENEKIVNGISETSVCGKAVPYEDPLNKSKHIKSNKLKKPVRGKPSKTRKRSVRGKPSKTRKRNTKTKIFVSNSSADEVSNSKTCDHRKQKAAKEQTLSMKILSKYNDMESECYNSNETTLTAPYDQNKSTITYNHAEENLTSITPDNPAYADTAITVHSVASSAIKKNKSGESCAVITDQVEDLRLKKGNIGLNYEDKTESNTPDHININDSVKTHPVNGKQVVMSNENNILHQTPLNIQAISQSIGSKRPNKKQKYLTKSDDNLIIHSNTLKQSIDVSSSKNANIFASQKYIEFRNVNEENTKEMNHFHNSELGEQSEFTSECQITTSGSFAAKNQNDVYYKEQSQQTSQIFFDYFSKTIDNKKENSRQDFVLGCSVKKHFNEAQNNNVISNEMSYLNERIKENLNAYNLNSCKTKVLKGTCLTLNEIQDCFLKFREYGQTETICSFPFLSGQFRLDVCVSEDTLNITVLKIMNSKPENRTNHSNSCMLVKEKYNPTSNLYSPAHSSRILPSSSPESETSLPDVCENVNNNRNPFSLFQSSISTLPQLTAANVEVSNEKALFCASPVNISSKSPTCKYAKSSFVNIINEAMHNALGDNLDETDSAAVLHHPKLMVENCELTKQNNMDKGVGNSCLSIKESNEYVPIIDKSAVTLSPESCMEVSKICFRANSSLPCNDENLDVHIMELSSEECNPFIGHEAIYEISPVKQSKYKHLNENSEAFSSNPGVVFANELIAALKIIDEKMDCRKDGRIEMDQDQNLCTFEDNCKDKASQLSKYFDKEKTIQKVELSKNKVVHQKPYRLSLKMKRNSVKCKQIQNCDSSDITNFQELDIKSGNNKASAVKKETISEISLSNNSCAENLASYSTRGFKQVPCDENKDLRRSKSDGHSEAYESGEDLNALNSSLSDGIPNANASEIIMGIEDFDKKIKSIEEKLKKCGHHENVKNNQSANHNSGKNSLLPENDSSYVNLEDSTDLFPLSVPPIPPAVLLCSDTNCFYKSFH